LKRKALKNANMAGKKHIVKNVEEDTFVVITETNIHVRNAEGLQSANIINKNLIVKNAREQQSANII
jgi:hypothetical protein